MIFSCGKFYGKTCICSFKNLNKKSAEVQGGCSILMFLLHDLFWCQLGCKEMLDGLKFYNNGRKGLAI